MQREDRVHVGSRGRPPVREEAQVVRPVGDGQVQREQLRTVGRDRGSDVNPPTVEPQSVHPGRRLGRGGPVFRRRPPFYGRLPRKEGRGHRSSTSYRSGRTTATL